MSEVVSLLERPVYTCPQVDRLLGLTKGTAKRWLNGYTRKGVFYQPILRVEPQQTRWVTWGEFVETRLFAGYRDVDDIPVKKMRRVVEVLRRELNRTYPLAYGLSFIRPEGRLLLWNAQEEAGLPGEFAVEVGTGQFVLTPWVENFVTAAVFDEQEGWNALALRPDPDFPDVNVDPRLRGGEPVIAGRNIRVATIAGLLRGGEELVDVASWYDLTEDQVRQAIAYDTLHPRIA